MKLDFNEFGMDFIGVIGSYVLEQLPFFVGFSESTFATQLAENQRRKYLLHFITNRMFIHLFHLCLYFFFSFGIYF